MFTDERDEARVDIPNENHAGDLERLFVSDTQTCCEFRLFAHLLHLVADFRPSSMDEYRLHPNVPQEHDIFDYALH